MSNYVDECVLPAPEKNLPEYRRIAQKADKIWREHAPSTDLCHKPDDVPLGASPHMIPSTTNDFLEKLEALRTELVDLAFDLERRGRLDAADVAITTSVRVSELCEELGTKASDLE